MQAALTGIKRLTPAFDRVLIEKPAPKQAVGGIVLPDSAQKKINWGTVVEVGPGKKKPDGTFTPVQFKKGDKVLLGEWSGSSVKINDKDFVLVKEDEILGVLELEKE